MRVAMTACLHNKELRVIAQGAEITGVLGPPERTRYISIEGYPFLHYTGF